MTISFHFNSRSALVTSLRLLYKGSFSTTFLSNEMLLMTGRTNIRIGLAHSKIDFFSRSTNQFGIEPQTIEKKC